MPPSPPNPPPPPYFHEKEDLETITPVNEETRYGPFIVTRADDEYNTWRVESDSEYEVLTCDVDGEVPTCNITCDSEPTDVAIVTQPEQSATYTIKHGFASLTFYPYPEGDQEVRPAPRGCGDVCTHALLGARSLCPRSTPPGGLPADPSPSTAPSY